MTGRQKADGMFLNKRMLKTEILIIMDVYEMKVTSPRTDRGFCRKFLEKTNGGDFPHVSS